MKRQILLLLVCLALVLSACSGSPSPTSSVAAPTAATQPTAAVQPSAMAAETTATAAPMAAPTAAPSAAAERATRNMSAGDVALELAGEDKLTAPPFQSDEELPTLPTSAPATSEPGPTMEPSQHEQSPLRAGEVDDNLDFSAYLDYLGKYAGPPIVKVDVQERYLINVISDQQQPVLDARVGVFDGERQIFEGRTYAGGKTIIFPRALGVAPEITSLRVLVEKEGKLAEGKIQRGVGATGTISIVLPGASALPAQPRLDILFLLDATGSMGDEIEQLQRTINTIVKRIDEFEPRPQIRLGLVAYRDRGDDYVTRLYDFVDDVASFRKTLLEIYAGGGGDYPESLNEGLHRAVQEVSWASDALRMIFLVADAPPHLDYDQDYSYVEETRVAVSRGIKIFPIAASGSAQEAEYVFRQLAQQTLGSFIFLTYQEGQSSGEPGDTTVHNVDPSQFTVEQLDDLVVQVVRRELARAQGH